MEFRVIGRGVLAGLIAGVLGFVFARVFAEPVIDRAIAYESGRDDALNALRHAAGLPVEPNGPEIFSRTIQSGAGIATGIIALSVAMGALVAVGFLVLQPRLGVRPRTLAWSTAAFGFLTVFALPFVKYPSNPPAIGHEFTITTRGHLYLGMVGICVVLLGLATFLAVRLTPRVGAGRALLVCGVGFLAAFGVVLAVMPSLGDLPANTAMAHDLGFARAATETPQPITNVTGRTLHVAGVAYAPGQIVYPGFDADVLWRFRWYSLLDQLLIWSGIAVVFGALMERMFTPTRRVPDEDRPRPAGATSLAGDRV